MTPVAHRARTGSAALWKDRRHLAWALHPRFRTAYLGWLGRGNLGDEAMYAALAARAGRGALRPAPLHRATRLFARGTRVDTLVLGGGTLLGRDEWVRRLDELLVATHVERLVVLGTGCEDICRARELGVATTAGLQRWSAILSHADYIGVRGPESQAALSDLGVTAEVIGDPGLLADQLPPRAGAAPRPVVGLSLAAVRDGLGVDRPRQLAVLRDAVRGLSAAGLEPVWFCMEAQDEELTRRLARQAGGHVMPFEADLERLLGFIDSCTVIVSERLHGGILGIARGVPSVMLSYKPKCVDFARSVNAEGWLVDLEGVEPEGLAGLVLEAAGEALPVPITEAVGDRRARLAERVAMEVGP